MRVLLTTLNSKYIHSSLALRCLKAYCNQYNEDISIKEYTINNTLLDILADIHKEKPDVIGLACYIWNYDMTMQLASLIKKVIPHIKIVLGGPEVSYNPEDVMEEFQYVDYIIQGEGEETLRLLLSALREGTNFYEIDGLVIRKDNNVVKTGIPQVVQNLDNIPFVYDDKDIDELNDRIIYYESSRGCPFSCQYCLSSATRGVRFYSLQRVYHDLDFFIKHNVRQVKFVDRTFNANKHYYRPIIKYLISQKCRTNFHFEIAADLLDDEVLEVLKSAPKGRFQFEVGVQSTYQPTLEEIERTNDWPKIVKNVSQILSNQNIHVHLDLIVGLPFENLPRFGQSFNDVYKIKPDMLQIGFLKLLKGSGVRRRANEHGYVHMDKAPYEVLGNKYMNYDEIRELKMLENVFEQVYNSGRFRTTLPYLVEKAGGDAFEFFRSLTAYWEKQNLHMVAHSTKSVFKYLLDFCKLYFTNDMDMCSNLLKFDSLLIEKGNMRPDLLPWNEDKWSEEKSTFWRNEKVVQKYITDYYFTTWRDLKRNYHIEVFETKLPEYLDFKSTEEQFTPVLFYYNNSIIEYRQIASEDFWLVGGRNNAL